MKVLVLGANGGTGQHVVRELIDRRIYTRILIREKVVPSQEVVESSFVEVVKGSINELNSIELQGLLHECTAIISCLGHNPTRKGMFGKPHDLVTDSVIKVCETIKKSSNSKTKLILMSTSGYTNTSEGETNSWGERVLFSVLSTLLPPHRDNVKAVDYLISHWDKNDEDISWIAVRPDSLVNDSAVSPYEVTNSPTRSPLFNAGKTSRKNVGHFMAELITDLVLWEQWACKTPVIYNKQV